MERAKRVRDSRTQQVHLIMSKDINSVGRLFGGRLMEWIDMLGGVVAMRHCNMEIVTVAIEKLEFLAPAYIGNILFMDAKIISVGNTSMRVQVDTYVESTHDGQRNLINARNSSSSPSTKNSTPSGFPGFCRTLRKRNKKGLSRMGKPFLVSEAVAVRFFAGK